RRVEALVRVGLAGEVRVGGHLPPGEVDRLESGLDHLHGLATGQRAERVDVRPGAHELPEALGATAGERVLLDDAAPQPDDVLGAVAASDAGPALLGGPAATQVVGGVEAGGRRGGTVGGGHGGAPLA